MSKICSKCGVEKELNQFSKYKRTADGLNSRCRDCCKAAYKQWADNNSEKLKEVRKKTDAARAEQKKQYREENKEHIQEYMKEYYSVEENRKRRNEVRRIWDRNNPDKVQQAQQKYKQSEKGKQKIKEYNAKKMEEDPAFKIAHVVRTRVLRVLKGRRKSDSTFEMVGCTPEYLKQYIEWQFDDKMTWENHGTYWHIDHITPLSWYDLTDLEQQKLAFHFTNLQPLSAADNLTKSDRWAD